MTLDAQQGAFGYRVLVQVEADDLARVGLDRVTDLHDLAVVQRLDSLQAESPLQGSQPLCATVEQLLAHCQQVHRFGIALEQGAPVGAVGDLAAEQVFDQPRLLPRGDAHDRQGLAGPLVKPTGRQLRGPGDADLDARRIGQVHHMVGHAKLLAPPRFTAGAGVVVAFFRGHDADIALGQLGHARVAVTLAEAGLGLAPTVDAMNRPQVLQAQGLADQRVDR
ncbi:hypothetical protein D9M71_193900 [compost metagenome]